MRSHCLPRSRSHVRGDPRAAAPSSSPPSPRQGGAQPPADLWLWARKPAPGFLPGVLAQEQRRRGLLVVPGEGAEPPRAASGRWRWVRVRLSCSPDHFLPHLGNLDFLLPFVPYIFFLFFFFSFKAAPGSIGNSCWELGPGLGLFLLLQSYSAAGPHELNCNRLHKPFFFCAGAGAATLSTSHPAPARPSPCSGAAEHRVGTSVGPSPRDGGVFGVPTPAVSPPRAIRMAKAVPEAGLVHVVQPCRGGGSAAAGDGVPVGSLAAG